MAPFSIMGTIDSFSSFICDESNVFILVVSLYRPIQFRHADSLGEDEEVMNKCMEEITVSYSSHLSLE